MPPPTEPAVSAYVALATVPVTFAPLSEVKFAPDPEKKLAVARLPRFALATVMLPVAVIYPATFAPVPVTTMIFALPAELIVTLALGPTTTLLLPLTIELPAAIVKLLSK